MCSNRSVRADHLEQAVWERVCALLEAPDELADEYRRRLHEATNSTVRSDELAQLGQQTAALQRGIGRLIDSYAAGVIDRSEFEPRIAGLRSRAAQLQDQQRAAAEAAEVERELILIMGQLEDFATRVRLSLNALDWIGTREVIRIIVRRIEIDRDHIEVVLRVPPPTNDISPFQSNPAGDQLPVWQDRTAGRRAHVRLDDPLATPGERLRTPHRRIGSHDPRQHGRAPAPPCRPPITILKQAPRERHLLRTLINLYYLIILSFIRIPNQRFNQP